MTEPEPNILIVEDDIDVADMLCAYFDIQGYNVQSVYQGEDVTQACQKVRPDLIILDIRLPDIDGYEVARRLRTNRRTQNIPIIFLTEKRGRIDRLQGLELGADDFISKPFDIQELRLRVRNTLRRSQQGSLTNPITVLPEGMLVEERLRECLEKDQWALLLISLENLESFRELYGFVASDDALRAVSLMIHHAVREIGDANDFVGQTGPDRFIVITIPAALSDLNYRIQTRLNQSLIYFYPLKDRLGEQTQEKQLKVRISQLSSNQGSFTDLEKIKAALPNWRE